MASRAQRRALRRARETEKQAGFSQRARARQAQVRPAQQPGKTQTGRREAPVRGRFIRESWGELKKVEWPGRTQVMTGTVVVVIACAIVGFYLWVNDLVWNWVVENVLLNR
jgi:preprotein translocase subunit SecE